MCSLPLLRPCLLALVGVLAAVALLAIACGGDGRPEPAPLSVKVTLDAERASSTAVADGGGTITATAADGTRFTLTVPPGALLGEETITLTPISSIEELPIEGTFVAGVNMAPDGLRFAEPATLEIDMAAVTDAENLRGFRYHEDGDLFRVIAVQVAGARAVLPIDRFSNAGVFTSVESLADIAIRCKGGGEGQALTRDEYYEYVVEGGPHPRSERLRIRSGVDDAGEYQTFEHFESSGPPGGHMFLTWTYLDRAGNEYHRIRQVEPDGSSRESDQKNGRDVDPSELDSIFTEGFATLGEGEEPTAIADDLDALRQQLCEGTPTPTPPVATATVTVKDKETPTPTPKPTPTPSGEGSITILDTDLILGDEFQLFQRYTVELKLELPADFIGNLCIGVWGTSSEGGRDRGGRVSPDWVYIPGQIPWPPEGAVPLPSGLVRGVMEIEVANKSLFYAPNFEGTPNSNHTISILTEYILAQVRGGGTVLATDYLGDPSAQIGSCSGGSFLGPS